MGRTVGRLKEGEEGNGATSSGTQDRAGQWRAVEGDERSTKPLDSASVTNCWPLSSVLSVREASTLPPPTTWEGLIWRGSNATLLVVSTTSLGRSLHPLHPLPAFPYIASFHESCEDDDRRCCVKQSPRVLLMTASAMGDPFDPLPFGTPPQPSSLSPSPHHAAFAFHPTLLPDLPSLSPFTSSTPLAVDTSFTSAPSPLLLSLMAPPLPSLSLTDFTSSLSSHLSHVPRDERKEALMGEDAEEDEDDEEDAMEEEGGEDSADTDHTNSRESINGSHGAVTSSMSPTASPSSSDSSSTSSSSASSSSQAESKASHRASAGASRPPPPLAKSSPPSTPSSSVGSMGVAPSAKVVVERRVSKACCNCSISKTKCDNSRPCGRCVRTDRTATCSDPVRKRRGRKRPYEDSQAVAAVQGGHPIKVEPPRGSNPSGRLHPPTHHRGCGDGGTAPSLPCGVPPAQPRVDSPLAPLQPGDSHLLLPSLVLLLACAWEPHSSDSDLPHLWSNSAG